MFNDDFTHKMIIDYLDQVHYWLNRFEVSRDVDHLDYAGHYAEVVTSYLPPAFQNLSVIALSNLHLMLSPNISKVSLEERCI